MSSTRGRFRDMPLDAAPLPCKTCQRIAQMRARAKERVGSHSVRAFFCHTMPCHARPVFGASFISALKFFLHGSGVACAIDGAVGVGQVLERRTAKEGAKEGAGVYRVHGDRWVCYRGTAGDLSDTRPAFGEFQNLFQQKFDMVFWRFRVCLMVMVKGTYVNLVNPCTA